MRGGRNEIFGIDLATLFSKLSFRLVSRHFNDEISLFGRYVDLDKGYWQFAVSDPARIFIVRKSRKDKN